MPHPSDLPHLAADAPFLTDGGLETTLIFGHGVDLPMFAAFALLDDEEGRRLLADYYVPYMALASARGAGFIAETPTWRANPDWCAQLGYDASGLDRVNRDAVALVREVALRADAPAPFLTSGCIGPRGDGYVADAVMSPPAAASYHRAQIECLADAGADMVTALTMTHPEEAAGIVAVATEAGIPVVVSFTVETDGRLPNGQSLGEAVTWVDEVTDGGAAYFMINCAHPVHFAETLTGEGWTRRIRGLRANASRMSHAELDGAEELDEGDPVDLGRRHGELRDRLPWVVVLGGCCGTDHRHVGEIAGAWATEA